MFHLPADLRGEPVLQSRGVRLSGGCVTGVAFDVHENEREKGERERWVLSFLRGGRGGGVTEVDL
jgi:hypothetical protein